MGLFDWKFGDDRAKFWSWFARASTGFVYPPPAFQIDEIAKRLTKVASGIAFLLMAKTGEGSRESTFQVSNADSFLAHLAHVAAGLAIDYDTEVSTDPTWSLWRETVEMLAPQLRT